jgi:hypothetical protein
MAKRFTETRKWNDPWFQDLDPAFKCVWGYILDHCDNAGVWVINTKLMSFQVGKNFTWEAVKSKFGNRLREFSPGRVWVPKFIEFQYGQLKIACPPHRPILSLLKSYGLFEDYQKGIDRVSDTLQEEEEDKEEEKEKEKEKKGDARGKQKPDPVAHPDTLAVYAFWKKVVKASARKADSLKWIERRGLEHGFETLVMSIVRYRNECTEKKTEEKFLKECANFFGEDATFEGFLPDPDFHVRYLDRAVAVLKGQDEKEG